MNETINAEDTLTPSHAGERTLHPATAKLVSRFTEALAMKLRDAEQKYGFSDDWLKDDWQQELDGNLLEHVAKGDPRDVAAFCAFAWHHGWSTAPALLNLQSELKQTNEAWNEAVRVSARLKVHIKELTAEIDLWKGREETAAIHYSRLIGLAKLLAYELEQHTPSGCGSKAEQLIHEAGKL